MKRIDFIGSPGVGKTTLYNLFMARRKRHEQWLTPVEAKINIAKEYLRQCSCFSKDMVRLVLIQLIQVRSVQNKLSESIYNSLASKALKERVNSWMPFIELCSESLGDQEKPPFYRFQLAKWFLNDLQDTALVDSARINKTVVFDESLSQRATGLLPWNIKFIGQQSRKYFKLMPPPDGLIVLQAEPEIIVQRIMARRPQKVNAQHEGLVEEELWERIKIYAEIVGIGSAVLRERGVQVLALDAALPVEVMLSKLNHFMRNGQ